MAFFKVFNIGSWNVHGVLPKLNDIEVLLARKKFEICEFQKSKTHSVEENKNSPSNRIFLDKKGNKQLGMGFLVNKSLKVTSTNMVKKRIFTLTVTKKDKFKSKSTPPGVKLYKIKQKQCELSFINSLTILRDKRI